MGDMPWDSIIGAAGDLAGGALQNIYNRKEASKNRRFQAEMSNTAHFREVADLRRAGLNPILSATGGHGASTPSGSQASSADFTSIGSKAANSVRASKELDATLKLMDEQASKAFEESRESQFRQKGLVRDNLIKDESLKQQQMRSSLMGAQLPYQLEKAKLTDQTKDLLKYERFLEPLYKIFGTGNSAKSLFE